VRDLLKEEVPAISSVAFYEIWAGAKSQEEQKIADFLSAFAVLPVTKEIAIQGAKYYREFRPKGLTLSTVDALIAATAFHHHLTLVTQNIRDFPMTDFAKRSIDSMRS
jgi:predicted nucleic acid-binding protein